MLIEVNSQDFSSSYMPIFPEFYPKLPFFKLLIKDPNVNLYQNDIAPQHWDDNKFFCFQSKIIKILE